MVSVTFASGVAAFTPVGPAVLAGAAVATVTTGLYGLVRSSLHLHDRSVHEQVTLYNFCNFQTYLIKPKYKIRRPIQKGLLLAQPRFRLYWGMGSTPAAPFASVVVYIKYAHLIYLQLHLRYLRCADHAIDT